MAWGRGSDLPGQEVADFYSESGLDVSFWRFPNRKPQMPSFDFSL